jgi:hypothetical protein
VDFKSLFGGPLPYVVWLVLSAVLLGIAWYIDPYVLVFTYFGTATLSALLFVIAMLHTWRAASWAAVACLPSMIAFFLLGTIRWH